MVTAVFVVLTLPRLLLHEVWRDEAWLWLVVGDAHGPRALFVLLARTGQGYLFPLLCLLARQLSSSVVAMQLLNLGLAAGGAFVFVRWSPFAGWLRVALVLGYFPFYEYAVISRHYAAGALLLWIACAAARAEKPLLLGVALGLLCQTTVYGFILALAVASGWLLLALRADGERLPRGAAAAGIGAALAGAAAGLVQLVPSPGTSFAPAWLLQWLPERAARLAMMPWRAFVPLPPPRVQFWNANVLDSWPTAQAVAGLLVLVLAAALLWRQRSALAVFAIGTVGLLAFGYVKLIGEARHQGHLWLLFIAALWLAGGPPRRSPRTWRAATLAALALVHCAAAAFASWVDLRHPFSNGAATAVLLHRRGLDRYPLLGHREPPAATVALALGRPLYSPSRRLFTTRPDWGPQQREVSDEELRCAARELARREGDIVLVINRQLPPWEELEPAGSRVGAIVRSEDYYLYRLRPRLLAGAPSLPSCP